MRHKHLGAWLGHTNVCFRALQRMFFWETGFRVTRRYRVMRYRLPADDSSGPTSQHVATLPSLRLPLSSRRRDGSAADRCMAQCEREILHPQA